MPTTTSAIAWPGGMDDALRVWMRMGTTQCDHVRDAAPRTWQQLRERLMGCFLEMPGLTGTVDDFSRLIGTTPQTCGTLLERLTAERALRRVRDGRYTRCADV
jgi:hypothetical protein